MPNNTRPPRSYRHVTIWLIFIGVLIGALRLFSSQAQEQPIIRINTGGPAQSVGDVTWLGCTSLSACNDYVSGGYAYTQNPPLAIDGVVEPANEAIYQTEWTGGATQGVPAGEVAFQFDVPVGNGTYTVRLHFAELNKSGNGQRVFDVQIENTTVLTNFDIFAETGGKGRAIMHEFPATVSDNSLTIMFITRVENAKVSAIEIIPAGPIQPGTRLFKWRNVADPPVYRFEAQGVAADDKLFVFGGFDRSGDSTFPARTEADVYDPATDTWTRLANVPAALTHTPVVVDGRTIWLIGGYQGDNPGGSSANVWLYNMDTKSWSAGPPLPERRAAGAAAILGRNLHFYSGAFREANHWVVTDYGDHYVLNLDDPAAGWTLAEPVPNPRNHIGGTAVGGKLYAVGGQYEDREDTDNQSEVDVYDPTTHQWTTVSPIPLARSHISASTLDWRDRVLVLGGSVNGGSSGIASSQVYLYDPPTDVWLRLPNLPEPRKTPVAGIINDRIFLTAGTNTWVGDFADTWETPRPMPVAMNEVAGGIISHTLYLVGGTNSATLAYDLSTDTWSSTSALAKRPFTGDHHAAEVLNGKLYLFGGLGNGADGKVQIYNPISDTWLLGADMLWAGGSVSTAVISDNIYVAGGIIGSSTTDQVARYDPASDTWTPLAPMPQGRNHAAAATDGAKLYIFGGRGPGSGDGNYVAAGFDTVQIYDPATNTWRSSASDSTIASLPQARGGMGKAVYARGEFYILGGETDDASVPNGVYDRVDIYNPATNTWHAGASMPTARHGIYPVVIADRIYVAGGGVKAAYSASKVLEVYNIPRAAPDDPSTPTPTCTPTDTAATASPAATATTAPTATATVPPATETYTLCLPLLLAP